MTSPIYKRDKLCWAMLLGLAVFILAAMVCIGATLRSPKGGEFAKSLGKSRSIVIPPHYTTNTLTWSGNYTQSVEFSVEFKPEIASAWSVIGKTTNILSYTHMTTNLHGYYRVGAFWP